MNKGLANIRQGASSLKRSATTALTLFIGVAIGLGLAQLQSQDNKTHSHHLQRIAALESRLAESEAWGALASQSSPAPAAPVQKESIEAPVLDVKPVPVLALKAKAPEVSQLQDLAKRFGAPMGDDSAANTNILRVILELQQQGALDYAEIVALLNHSDPEVRRGALKLLRYGKAKGGVDAATQGAAREALLAILDDPSAALADRQAALSSLPIEGEDAALRARLQMLAEGDKDLARAVIDRLGAIPGGRDFLAQMARSSEGTMRRAALGALLNPKASDLGDPAQKNIIVRMARDPDAGLRTELFHQLKFAHLSSERSFDAELMGELAGVYAEERSDEALASLDGVLSFNAAPEHVEALERWAANPSISDQRRARLSELAQKAAKATKVSGATKIFEAYGEMLKDAESQGFGEVLKKQGG